MKIYLSPERREELAMILRQDLDAGWSGPEIRTALYKIQRSRHGGIHLTNREVETVLGLLGDKIHLLAEVGDYMATGPHSKRWAGGGTTPSGSYPSTSTIEQIEREERLED